jgi:hypothetical protein
MTTIEYEPDGATLRRFFRSDAFVRGLIGPFGSGKTTACCIEVFRRATQQEPDSEGIRRTRWAAIRSTFPELRTTTVVSWRSWFGDRFGAFNWTPPFTHTLRFPLEDGTQVEAEVLFIALDGPDGPDKLKGLELTGGWINEAREVPKAILDTLLGRVGRYPAKRNGGPTWTGVLLDTNPPDTDHWLYRLAEEERPPNWAIFRQPGGLMKVGSRWQPNPAAENLRYLRPGYYIDQLAGQTDGWIAVHLGGEYGYVLDGKPVYPEFADSMHVAPEAFAPIPHAPLVIGLDFGLTPAAVFCQRSARGQWLVLAELVAEDMGVQRFAEQLALHLQAWFPELKHSDAIQCRAWGDPAGNARAQTDERSCLEIIRKFAGISALPAPTNAFKIRREAVAGALGRLIDGKPGLVVSPACKVLRKGFAGGYRYRRVKIAGDERYHDEPDKNAYSHPHDALQYALSGGGEGLALLRRSDQAQLSEPFVAKMDWSVWGQAS